MRLPIRFSKPPFEAELMCHGGRRITLTDAHLKSKAPHGARSKDEAMLISIANRRKQLAQALFIRGRVVGYWCRGDRSGGFE